MDIGDLVDIFHNLSAGIITLIILLSMAVSFFVFKYFDHDFWNQDRWSD